MKITLQKIKSFFAHFFTLNDSSHNIAGGAALGVFLGVFPGVGLLVALIIVSFLKLNKTAAILCVLATNTWSIVVTLPLAAIVGGFLFGQSPRHLSEEFHATYNLGFNFFISKIIFFDLALPLMTGFLVVSVGIALFFYFVIFFLLKYNKIKR